MTTSSAPTLEGTLGEFVARRELAGVVALSWHAGRETRAFVVGRRDVARSLPMTRDTIFRIASLTKPVVSVAALTLLDEHRFELDDAITGIVPELSAMRVLSNAEGPLEDTVPAARSITFRDLLTHRSGLTYGEFHRGPIGAAYRNTLGAEIDNAFSPDEWIAKLATLPLVDQPGNGFHYGVSSDLLGFVIARMEMAKLSGVVRQRVLDPLGMRDTDFTVPQEKRGRRAALTGFDDSGSLTTLGATPGGHALAERPDTMTFESGSGGLWSTADDYLTFARLFVGGGAVDGVRVLRGETCALMMTNQLTVAQRAEARIFGRSLFAEGHGYGLGVAVMTNPDLADALVCRGGVGTVGWPGAYGGWWQADPTAGSVLVFLFAQHGGSAADGAGDRPRDVERNRAIPLARARGSKLKGPPERALREKQMRRLLGMTTSGTWDGRLLVRDPPSVLL